MCGIPSFILGVSSFVSPIDCFLNIQLCYPIDLKPDYLRNSHRPKPILNSPCEVHLPEKIQYSDEASGIPFGFEGLSASRDRLLLFEFLEEDPVVMQGCGTAFFYFENKFCFI